MVVSPALLGMVPEWALLGAGWLAVGVFVMVSLTCYAYRRVVVPGDGGSRVDDALVAVSVGVVCALVSASLVVGVCVFM